MEAPARVLVAGIGNIFLGDDAFGVEVARHLAGRPLPPGVRVRDFGIRGFDLALALLEAWDLAILVDALPRGGIPGTLYLLEPELHEVDNATELLPGAAHELNPQRVLQLVHTLGGHITYPVRVVGCEPATFGSQEDPVMGLSDPVRAAIPGAVRMIEELVVQTQVLH